jgi:6-pyruvoyltetrahydropterin/6-carboxytetrahydropterin synthase
MTKIRVTKYYDFEMAHALWNYDGLCKNIHGHSYKLHVTVIGVPIDDSSSTKDGMVIDFSDLKRIVKTNIVDVFDHSFVVNKNSQFDKTLNSNQMYERIHIVDFQPTCENMVIHFVNIIKPLLSNGIELKSLKLYETATSFAEWNADDN